MNVTIIGAGPCGLTIVTLLSLVGGYKCKIIDREDDIGGCHRVRRTPEGFFTEHGPRVYINSYLNFIEILKLFNIDFYDAFSPYKHNFPVGTIEFFSIASFYEIICLTMNYIAFIFSTSWTTKITMKTFLHDNKFSEKTIDYVNKLCKLTDGADITRYTLFEFFQLINQNIFYSIYQPNLPNDEFLFPKWKTFLEDRGVIFQLKENINKIVLNDANNRVSHLINEHENNIYGDVFIFATPLSNLIDCFNNSSTIIQNSFGSFKNLKQYNELTKYDTYISVTFQWKKPLNIPDIWGNGHGDWNVAWINMTDNMQFSNMKTLLSVCVSDLDNLSKHSNKTANQTNTENELIDEIFYQINTIYEFKLPKPDKSILSPGVHRKNNKWISIDDAYMKTIYSKKFPFISNVSNLYSIGTHNEQSEFAFTSMESAIINAVKFCYKFDNRTKSIHNIKHPITLNYSIIIILCILSVILLLLLTKKTY